MIVRMESQAGELVGDIEADHVPRVGEVVVFTVPGKERKLERLVLRVEHQLNGTSSGVELVVLLVGDVRPHGFHP